jgi:hypothetical protein
MHEITSLAYRQALNRATGASAPSELPAQTMLDKLVEEVARDFHGRIIVGEDLTEVGCERTGAPWPRPLPGRHRPRGWVGAQTERGRFEALEVRQVRRSIEVRSDFAAGGCEPSGRDRETLEHAQLGASPL